MLGYYPNSMCETLFRHQDRIGLFQRKKKRSRVSKISDNIEEERKDFINQEEDFSRSVDATQPCNRSVYAESDTSSFVQSVVVVPHSSSDGKYSIYTGIHDNVPLSNHTVESELCRSSYLSSLKYDHNISNPELRQQRFENDNPDWAMRKQSLLGKLKRNSSSSGSRLSSTDNLSVKSRKEKCQCGQYHAHVFKQQPSKMSKLTLSKSEEHSASEKSTEFSHSNKNQNIISTIFWKASLNFSEYKHGNNLVDFKSLWPSVLTIRSLLQDGIEDTGLRGALWELCFLVLADGPVSVLQELLEMKYISK